MALMFLIERYERLVAYQNWLNQLNVGLIINIYPLFSLEQKLYSYLWVGKKQWKILVVANYFPDAEYILKLMTDG